MQDLQVYKQKGTQSNTQFTIDNIQHSVHIFKGLKPLVYSDSIHLRNPCKLERLLLKDLKIENCASCPIASNGKFYSQK